MTVTVNYTYQETSLTTSAVAGTYGNSVVLSATLSDHLSGKSIDFSLNNTFMCTGTTDSLGFASCSTPLKTNVGTNPAGVKATFYGDPPYGASTGTANLSVSARPITVSAATDMKTYDGTTSSTVVPTITSGSLASGDSVTWIQTFNNRNVGSNKTLTPSGTILDGNGGNNYAVTSLTATGAINKRAITITALTQTKTYDGTPFSSLTPTMSPLEPGTGDTITLSQAFNNKNVGTGKLITPNAAINDGNSGNNYAVTLVTTTGAITQRSLTIAAVPHTRAYDGTNTSSLLPTITPGLGAGDTAAVSQVFSDKNAEVGKTITPFGTIQDGSGGSNYIVTLQNATGTITPLGITVNAEAKSRPYGTADPALTYQYSPALISGDSFTGSLVRQAGNDAGVYPIVQGDLRLSANYAITYVGANFTITKLNQTIVVSLNAPPWRMIGETFRVSATSSSGMEVTYSASGGCTNVGEIFTMTSSSVDCSARFDQAGGTNYNPAPRITQIVAAAEAPVILQDPVDQTVLQGENAVFISTARGAPTPIVQWEVSIDGGLTFELIPDQVSSTLTIPLPPPGSQGYFYRAVYTNSHGNATTAAAKLNLLYNSLFLPYIKK